MHFNSNLTLMQGIDAQNEGRLEEAKKLYNLVLLSEPHNSDAHHNLGIISLIYSKLDDALVNFKNALTSNPSIEQFWISYVETLIKKNDFVKAKKTLKKARKNGIQKKLLYSLNEKIISKIKNPSPSENEINDILGAFQSQDFEAVEKLSHSMTKSFPLHPFAWKALSAALRNNKKYDEAIKAHKKNIELSPKDPEAYNNFGITLKELNKTNEAINYYIKAIELNKNYSEAYNNLGTSLNDLGKLKEAEINFTEAINLNNNFSEAHNNLGLLKEKKLDFKSAAESFKNALKANPNNIDAHNNLAFNFKEQGNVEGSIIHLVEAIKRAPLNLSSYYNLSVILKEGIEFKQSIPILELIILELLKKNTIIRPIDISKTVISLIKNNEPIKVVLENYYSNKLNQNLNENISILANNTLLLKLLSLSPLLDLEFEGLLKKMRSLILYNIKDLDQNHENIEFCKALANQCFINEYLYEASIVDIDLCKKLSKKIEMNLIKGIQPSIIQLLCLACFNPLYEYKWHEMLTVPKELETIFNLQIFEVKKERYLENKIKCLSKISHDVSLKVRDQYEENPYPRWIKTGLSYEQTSLDEFAHKTGIKFDDRSFKNYDNLKILIAGCGTGQHSLLTSSRFKNSKIIAIDLSKKSLAFAKRKTEELGIENIEYYQADILDLKNTFSDFDIIESAGVLHHLEDPLSGWNSLNSLLKPGGMMKIGLYSQLARENIKLCQKEIKEMKLLPNRSDIKSFRNIIINSEKEHHRNLTESADFFSLSEVRDLLFHVQEHTFTIPEIKEMLSKLGLIFCGFDNPKIKKLFKKSFPENADIYNLDLWNDLENSDKNIFAGMYQFWCQKV